MFKGVDSKTVLTELDHLRAEGVEAGVRVEGP